jgi:hypothetical protein
LAVLFGGDSYHLRHRRDKLFPSLEGLRTLPEDGVARLAPTSRSDLIRIVLLSPVLDEPLDADLLSP